jgi:hypothetical protein
MLFQVVSFDTGAAVAQIVAQTTASDGSGCKSACVASRVDLVGYPAARIGVRVSSTGSRTRIVAARWPGTKQPARMSRAAFELHLKHAQVEQKFFSMIILI